MCESWFCWLCNEVHHEGQTCSFNGGNMHFTYVDITCSGCEGWLNLFFGDQCISMVSDVDMADNMRKSIPKKGVYVDEFKNDNFTCSGCE